MPKAFLLKKSHAEEPSFAAMELAFPMKTAVVREMKSHPANIPYFPSPNTPWPAIGLPSATAPPNTLPMSPSSHADLYPRQPLATKNPEALWMNNNFPPFSHSYLNPHHHATGTPTGGNGAPVHWTTVGTSPFRPVYPQPYPNHHQHHPCLSPPPFAHLYPALQNRLQNLTYPLKPTTPVKPPSATTPFDIDTILGRHNCNKKLVTFDLDDSMKTSEEDEPMEVVASSGKRRESLKNVIKRKLGGAGKTPCRYPCPECKKSYSTLSGLVKHQESHCPALHRLAHRCKFCDKVYSQQGALKMHMKTHTLPNQCTACGKRFSRPWLLQGHMRVHSGEKPYECKMCHRPFADKSNLRAHLQTHEDVKKYKCQICQKTFSRMSLLNKHQSGTCCRPGSSASSAMLSDHAALQGTLV